MATKEPAAGTGTAGTVKTENAAATKKAARADEKKFPLPNLAKNCRELFGVSSCAFAGATAGLTGEYTVKQMEGIIKEWCGKEVK